MNKKNKIDELSIIWAAGIMLLVVVMMSLSYTNMQNESAKKECENIFGSAAKIEKLSERHYIFSNNGYVCSHAITEKKKNNYSEKLKNDQMPKM